MATGVAVVAWNGASLGPFQQCSAIHDLALIVPNQVSAPPGDHTILKAENLQSSAAIADALKWFQETDADYLLWVLSSSVDLSTQGLKRLVDCARETKAAAVYSDYLDQDIDRSTRLHPLIDYQSGSLRDDFDFGQALLLDGDRLRAISAQMQQECAATTFGGWYDLRLRLSEVGPIFHLPEPTYTLPFAADDSSGEDHFSYVDPRNREYQGEMEQIATAHLKRIGAYSDPPKAPWVGETSPFLVEASVVIPVRNRQRTISDAVESALSQEADFAFNVIVVDNHSTDKTSQILSDIAQQNPRLIHLVPKRTDLGIGGCWNEAVHSEACGRFAIQLDSDDLYAKTDVLKRIVAEFQRTGCAMVIGSYTIVDFDLNPIPPGLVDHREWTDENGHNNALRIAGMGAPRAFHVPTLRSIGFPNASYGEDYAVALKIASRYPIGRIYDSLYWCRRWEENSDHALPIETMNRYTTYKDRLRSIEIAARQNRQP